MSVVYEVKKPIKHAGIGLERQPGVTVHSSELAATPDWRDALIAVGAIVAKPQPQEQEPRKAAKRV